MPHDLEAERAVLGAVLLRNEMLDVAETVVAPEHFFRRAHGLLFAAMRELRMKQRPIDPVMLRDHMGQAGFEEVGGAAYVSGLMDGVPKSTNVSHYADIVRERARRRLLIHAAVKAEADAYGDEMEAPRVAEALVEAAHAAVLDVGTGVVSERDAILQYIANVEREDRPLPVASGFTEVDALLRGGFRRQNFVIVAARPSVGKTAFALCMAASMADRGIRPLMFSLEMGQDEIAARLVSARSGVAADRVEGGQMTDAEVSRVTAAMGAASAGGLLVETFSTTVAEIGAWCRRVDPKPDVLLVDYIQLLAPERQRESSQSNMAEISRALKRLAKQENVVVVGLSQLSRAPETRKDKRPQLSDLRDSGALEQDCDVALLLYRGELYGKTDDNEGIAEVIFAKQRNGPVGVVRLAFSAEQARFTDLEWRA